MLRDISSFCRLAAVLACTSSAASSLLGGVVAYAGGLIALNGALLWKVRAISSCTRRARSGREQPESGQIQD